MRSKIFITGIAVFSCLCFTLAETADQEIKMGVQPNRSISSVDQEVISQYNRVAHALNPKNRLEKSHDHDPTVNISGQMQNKKFSTDIRDLKSSEAP